MSVSIRKITRVLKTMRIGAGSPCVHSACMRGNQIFALHPHDLKVYETIR